MEMPILLVSDGLVHPSLLGRYWLHRALAGLPGFRFRRVASLETLPGLPPDAFRAIVLYVHHDTISRPAQQRLEAFVEQGGGLLAIHSASASFKEEPGFQALLGGRFVTHGPVEEFVVQPSTPGGEFWGDMPAFSVRDELYRHEYDTANRVHLHTAVGEECEPVVWTRRQGQGRVCYCSLGHTMSAMRHPAVQQILRTGLRWVCGQEAP